MAYCLLFPSRPENNLEYNEQNLFSWDYQMLMNMMFHLYPTSPSGNSLGSILKQAGSMSPVAPSRLFQNITAFRDSPFLIFSNIYSCTVDILFAYTSNNLFILHCDNAQAIIVFFLPLLLLGFKIQV